jgi:uncharacterized protein (TIGR00251 family)
VTPKAGADAVVGWQGEELRIRVTAAPEGGRANAAVCKLVASVLAVPKSAVRVSKGDASRHKTLEIDGADEGDLRAAFPR